MSKQLVYQKVMRVLVSLFIVSQSLNYKGVLFITTLSLLIDIVY